MPDEIIPIDRVHREAAEAARTFTDVNDACPYPFASDAGHAFRKHFEMVRLAMAAAPERTP